MVITKSKSRDPAIQSRMDFGVARVRDVSFDAIRALWAKRQAQGLRQSDLAQKMGRDPSWVSRSLRGPGNWTMRTFGEFVQALDGEVDVAVTALEDGLAVRHNIDAYAMRQEQLSHEKRSRQLSQGTAMSGLVAPAN